MAIHVDVLIQLHERQFQQASRKLKREADKLGVDLSDRLSTPFKNVSPKAVKALDNETDAVVRLRRSTNDLIGVLKDKKASTEQQTRALEDFSKATRAAGRATDEFKEKNERELRATRERAYVMGQNTIAFKQMREEIDKARTSINSLQTANKGFIQRNPALAKSFERVGDAARKTADATAGYNRMVKDGTASRDQLIRQGNAVRDAYIAEQRLVRDTTTAYREASDVQQRMARDRAAVIGPNIATFRQMRNEMDGARASVTQLQSTNQRFIDDNQSLVKNFEQVGDKAVRTAREVDKYNRMVLAGSSSREQLIRQSQAVRDAYQVEARAIRDATTALSDKQKADRDRTLLNRARDQEAMSMSNSIKEMGTNAFLLSRGLATLSVPPAMIFLIDLAKVAVTAAQSVALLPAAATAAAAGIGTLQLATAGFSDTISNMGDPEKFAEAINKLAPNAQQAALEIKELVEGPLKALQQATQDVFFAGTPELLHNLANTFTPMMQQMTTGIAGAMNQMMTDVGDQLMTPESQAQVQAVFANITAAFHELAPMAPALSQAFLDLTSVGADFLPGLARDMAEVAREFANFIREARDNGTLREFMQNGIDAVKALGDGLMQLGGILYEAFGEDGKQNIADFKDAMQGLNDIISVITLNFDYMAADMREEFSQLTGPAQAYVEFIMDIPEALATAGQAFTTFANLGITAFNKVISGFNQMTGGIAKHPLAKLLSPAAAALGSVPPVPQITNTFTGAGDSGMWSGTDQLLPQTPPANRFDDRGYSGDAAGDKPPPGAGREFWTNPATNERLTLVPGLGWVPVDDPRAQGANLGPHTPGAVPPPPPPGGAKKPSESDVLNDIRGRLDPNTFAVDPFQGMNLPAGLGPGTGGGAPGGSVMPGNPFVMPSAAGTDPRTYAHSVVKPMFEQFGLEVGDHAADQHGEHQMGALDIMVPDITTGQQVLQRVMQDPNLYGAIFNNQTYGYGNPGPRPYGGDNPHTDHVHAFYQPGRQGNIGGAGGAGGAGYSPLAYDNSNPYDPSGLGYYQTDQSEIIGARNDVVDKAHTFQERQKDLAAAEQSGLKSQEEIEDLRWKAYEAERDWREAQAKLGEATTGKFKELNDKTTNTMKDVGAELDADFGISQGLAGIAKNLTMFLGNLAFAPMMGQLSAIQQANEQATGIQGGHGLIGMMGAQNIAQGKSPFFGRPLSPGGNNGGLASIFGRSTPMGNAGFGGSYGAGGYSGAMPGSAAGGAESWRPAIRQALATYGSQYGITNMQAWEDAMVAQIETESGGNPNVGQNLTDSNAAAGHPSTGLAQFIPSTFAANNITGGSIEDPFAQIAAMIPYVSQKYGMDPSGAPLFIGQGHGYNEGGLVEPQIIGNQLNQARPPAGTFNPGILLDTSTTTTSGWPAGRKFYEKLYDHPLDTLDELIQNEHNARTPDPSQRVKLGEIPWWNRYEYYSKYTPGFGEGQALKGFSGGGIRGPGSSTSDSIPAYLSNGEYVVNARATSLFGPLLEHINGFQAGGLVTPVGPAPGPAPQTVPYGGAYGTPSGTGAGGVGITSGGAIDTAIGMAASAADVFAPGAGQAAQIAIKLANRAIQYGGEVASIGVQGLMETFLPTGASELANNSWLTRIAGGLAGAAPAIPNLAGQATQQMQQPTPNQMVPPMPPGDQHLPPGAVPGQPPPPGPTINLEYNNVGATEDRAGADISYHLGQAYSPAPLTGSR